MSLSNLSVIILAAGHSTRMQSALPKVLHTLGGKTLLNHVLDTVVQLTPTNIYVVYSKDLGAANFTHYPITWVNQMQPQGTAHAVMQVLPYLKDEKVLILYADTPLIAVSDLQSLIKLDQGLSLLTTVVDYPYGFGRIIRDDNNNINAIVEQKDLTDKQKKITEINPGIYITKAENLRRWLPQINTNNQQQEFYLTDIIALAVEDKVALKSQTIMEATSVLGINTRRQLMQLERYYQQQLAEQLLNQGVSIKDSQRLDIRGQVIAAQDAVIDVNVMLLGQVQLGKNCVIGAHCVLRDVTIGDNTIIESHCVIEQSIIGQGCRIGPFAHLRPGTQLADFVKIGNFVEIKNSSIGVSSKIPHLSYVGDSDVGQKVNIGAGVITVNYNGAQKFRTIIEDEAFIGCDSQLIAPVTIEQGAYIAAGSTITQTAPANSLTICRERKQTTVKRWQKPQKNEAV